MSMDSTNRAGRVGSVIRNKRSGYSKGVQPALLSIKYLSEPVSYRKGYDLVPKFAIPRINTSQAHFIS